MRHRVGTRDPVCFFLTNSPEMMFSWLGSWCVGAFPALINYNLSGEGLIHCLRLSKSRVVLVDEDSTVRARIEEVRDVVEKELGMAIIVLDGTFKKKIRGMSTDRPGDQYRESILDSDSSMILFTRYVSCGCVSVKGLTKVSVAQLASLKRSQCLMAESCAQARTVTASLASK